jgi:hypothetical protein
VTSPMSGMGQIDRRALGYVAAVAVLAAIGVLAQSPWPLLLAAVLGLPASLVVLPVYYLAYGLLALVPGANPSSTSGSGTGAAGTGTVTSVVTGEPATWFTVTAYVLAVLLLGGAAALNALLLQALRTGRRRHTGEA